MAKPVGKFSKSSRESTLGKIVDEFNASRRIDAPAKGPNALEFIEDRQFGLGVTLSQVQRIMTKIIFGIPLDFRMAKVPVWDMYKEKLLYTFANDVEYLDYVYNEGRTNISNWQDASPHGYSTANLVVGRRGGKALSVDELIPTPEGFKRNGDLITGDRIFDERGQVQTVLSAHPIEDLDAYKVTFDDGTFVYANGEHLWHTWTHRERKNARRRRGAPAAGIPIGFCHCGCGQHTNSDGHGNPRRFISGHQSRCTRGPAITGKVRTTLELMATLRAPTSKQESNHALPLAAPIHLPDRKLPIDPYCLGVWLGDGHKHSGIITATDEDAFFLKPHFEKAGFVFRKLGCERMGWSVLGLIRPLRLLGLKNNKHIPHEYLWAGEAQRLSILQGLMDSDGACLEDGQVEFCNTDENLSRGVYHLAASLGLKPAWTEGRARLYGKDCGPKYLVKWTADLPVFRLPRKLARLRPIRRPWTKWRYIVNVEPAGRMKMRCLTTTAPSHLYLFGKNFNVTHNSELVSAIGCVKLRNLLQIHDPQIYYELIKGSPIDFTLLGTDEESSTTVFDKMAARVNSCSFYSPFLRQNDTKVMTFVSEADQTSDKRDIKPSITVAAYACTTRGIRGPSSYFLALDEFAHFRSNKDANSEDIWTAATPSTSRFPNKQDPERVDSLIMMISSPLNKIGQMYETHKQALADGIESGTFTFRCSTVEMYPKIPRERLAQFRKDSGDAYKAEYGGEFLDGAGSYVPPQKFEICVDEDRENLVRFSTESIGRKFFWAVDYGTQNDATALAIAHLEMVDAQGVTLVYDYIDRMMVGEAFTGPGVLEGERIKTMKELDIRDVISWLVYMHGVLPCYRGVTDQHGGTTLKQLLQINGITTMDLVHLTDQINSRMYFALRGYIDNGAASFPNVAKFKTEFNMLEASFKSKYVLKVEAPSEKGAHDDMADAAALVAWLAQLWLEEEGHLDLDPSGKALQIDPRIAGRTTYTDPNDVSLRDLQVEARMHKLGIGLMLPPNLRAITVANPWMHSRPRGRGRR